MAKLKIVVATRVSEADFHTQTATGRSLRFYNDPGVELMLFPENTQGLSTVYNRAIDACKDDPAILVFAHDDLHLTNFFWRHELDQGLHHFPIVGIVGNRRRVAGQSSWAFVDDRFTWDEKRHFSGVVGHGQPFTRPLSDFGPSCCEVKLLDGLFIAVHSQTLWQHGIRFDEQFQFHFYDLDFCRQAEQKGVKMGTWKIAIFHESPGNFSSDGWRQGYAQYMNKWKG
ncbi:glycosyltransferase [Magnetococcus sp. PR-3]|uniref:glycosyltransferase n=1 Tax=Magnetococcus sp. PR-3 TaxID=3120355 RepID=UPI002FCE5ADE